MRRRILGPMVAFAAMAASIAGWSGGGQALAGRSASTAPVRSPFHATGSPSGLSFPVGKNVDITKKNGAQSETSVAVDPTDPNHLLAGDNDLTDTSKFYESFDAGKTWVSAGLNVSPNFCYDTWIDFNAQGDAFVAYECSDQRIAARQAGTTTWVKTTLTNAGGFPDRDMVVVDTGAASPFKDSVYIGYDDNGANNTAYLMYSRTGFGGWVRSAKINDGSALTIGVNAAVAPDGTVYATWLDFNGKKIRTDRSTDGGATWSTDSVVTNMRLNTASFFIFIPPQNSRGIVPMPMTTVAPAGAGHAGRLYVAYTDKSTTGADTDTFVRFSDNGGATWSPETKVNDDTVGAYQFHPQIAVAPNGTVAVSFYDTRTDPNDHRTNRMVAYSTDGGVTWSANVKVSTGESDETLAFQDPNQYGDYQNMDASSTGAFHLVWTDSRSGNPLVEEMAIARVKP